MNQDPKSASHTTANAAPAEPTPARARCAGCGEYWPCSDSRRTDINPLIRASHFVRDAAPRLTRTVYAFAVGDRVQLHPATDSWMRGDRFGVVEAITRNGKLRIRMDKSGELRRTDPLNVLGVVSREGVI